MGPPPRTGSVRSRVATALIVVIVVASTAVTLSPDTSRAAADSQNGIVRAEDPVPGKYIVTLHDVDANEVAPLANDLAARHKGRVVEVYEHALEGFAARMTEAQAVALADDPRVATVYQDARVRIATTQASAPWG